MTKTLTEQQIRKIIENGTEKAAKVCEKKFYGKPKSLTEQWREGKLPNGNYYTICSGWSMETFPCIVYCERNCFDANVIEVLAPVPSYDECNELVQKIHILNEQNTKQYNELCEEIKKNNILEKRLKIATKALKGVCVWANTGNGGEQAVKKVCDKALKEMEGVK